MSALDDIVEGAPDDGEGTETYERNGEAYRELAKLRASHALLLRYGSAIQAFLAAQKASDEDASSTSIVMWQAALDEKEAAEDAIREAALSLVAQAVKP